jgi:hypothetical protein
LQSQWDCSVEKSLIARPYAHVAMRRCWLRHRGYIPGVALLRTPHEAAGEDYLASENKVLVRTFLDGGEAEYLFIETKRIVSWADRQPDMSDPAVQ